MTIYHMNPLGSGTGFKVHIADQAGGLRVVGIFPTAADAEAWIAVDRGLSDTADEADRARAADMRNPAA